MDDVNRRISPQELLGQRRAATIGRLASYGKIALMLAPLLMAAGARAEEPIVLEAQIPLGEVAGRIDQMALDLQRRRLFVAEFGNDTVGVVDLDRRQVAAQLQHQAEPQGIGYDPAHDMLYVASARDGTVRLFQGAGLAPAGSVALGKDADNIRIDRAAGLVFVGYGSGGLAVIDAATREKRADIKLGGHPEGFQLAPGGDRIFVNVPDAREIAVIDSAAQQQVARWPTRDASANFPMALEETGRVAIVFRDPAQLVIYAADGGVIARLPSCADADDVFVDAGRHRLYVSCGEGVVDVVERQAAGYRRLARVPTAPGARTSFFSPELDRLFVARRASVPAGPASILVFRPTP
jgi:DNA-binding beta-propeller fold protein YncE